MLAGPLDPTRAATPDFPPLVMVWRDAATYGINGTPGSQTFRLDYTDRCHQRVMLLEHSALPDVEEEVHHKQADVECGRGRRSPPWLASFLVLFAAEWGDLTRLATVGLVAQTGLCTEMGVCTESRRAAQKGLAS